MTFLSLCPKLHSNAIVPQTGKSGNKGNIQVIVHEQVTLEGVLMKQNGPSYQEGGGGVGGHDMVKDLRFSVFWPYRHEREIYGTS